MVYGLSKQVTGPRWTVLRGSLRSCDGNCNKNVTLKYNLRYIAITPCCQVSHDHRSFERNLSNCEQKPEKVRTSTGFEPVTSRYRL